MIELVLNWLKFQGELKLPNNFFNFKLQHYISGLGWKPVVNLQQEDLALGVEVDELNGGVPHLLNWIEHALGS